MGILPILLVHAALSLSVWARSEINQLRATCDRRWELILSHDEFGNVTFGSKSELRHLAMRGNYVKASIYFSDYLLQLPSDNMNRIGEELCFQSLKSMAHNGTHLDTDYPLHYFMVCTTGHVTRRDMNSSLTFRLSSDWYVKDICPSGQPVYSNYLDGSSTWTSSVGQLHEAATRMGLVGAMRDKPYVFSLNSVLLDPETGEVNGQSIQHIGQKYEENYVTFHDNPYRWLSFWSTLGYRDNARFALQQHTPYAHNADTAAVDWYADVCWRLIYSTDVNGLEIQGSVDDLIDHIQRGHRVRVRYDDVNMEVSNLRVGDNNVVVAQILQEVSRVGGFGMNRLYIEDDTHFIISLVHSTGKVNSYRYRVGTTTKTVNPPARKAMEWMVDTRPWKTVFKTSAPDNLAVVGSTFELSEVVMSGASVRLRLVEEATNHSLFFQANNMRLDFVSDTIYAEALDCVSDKKSRIIDEFELPLNAYNKYYRLASDGNILISTWNYGSDTFRSEEAVNASDITWFANL